MVISGVRVCPGGVSAWRRVSVRGVSAQGVSAQGMYTPPDPEADTPLDPQAETPWIHRQTPPAHCMLGYTPTSRLWTEGMTHACENITLPQTSFAGSNHFRTPFFSLNKWISLTTARFPTESRQAQTREVKVPLYTGTVVQTRAGQTIHNIFYCREKHKNFIRQRYGSRTKLWKNYNEMLTLLNGFLGNLMHCLRSLLWFVYIGAKAKAKWHPSRWFIENPI